MAFGHGPAARPALRSGRSQSRRAGGGVKEGPLPSRRAPIGALQSRERGEALPDARGAVPVRRRRARRPNLLEARPLGGVGLRGDVEQVALQGQRAQRAAAGGAVLLGRRLLWLLCGLLLLLLL